MHTLLINGKVSLVDSFAKVSQAASFEAQRGASVLVKKASAADWAQYKRQVQSDPRSFDKRVRSQEDYEAYLSYLSPTCEEDDDGTLLNGMTLDEFERWYWGE